MAQRAISNELRRVYLVSWWFAEFGGMERHITELAKSLRNRGIEVIVFTEMPTRRGNQYRRELEDAGIPFVAPKIPRAPVAWWQRRFPLRRDAAKPVAEVPVARAMGGSLMARLLERSLNRRLKREPPDAVHVHGWRLSQWVVTWCANRGIPAIYTEHSTISDWGGPVDPAGPELLSGAGEVACVSDAARNSLARWMPGRDIALHHHIIPLPDLAPPRKPQALLAIITVARLRAEKGLDILLHAAAKLLSRGVTFQLEIVGDGPLHDDLLKLRRELHLETTVQFTGSLDATQVREKLRTADIFVLPSRTEALSLALLEAMSHALAIAATSVGGIPEFIRNGDTGLLVPPESAEALAEAIDRLAADPGLRVRVGQNARRYLESSRYSETSCVENVIASYDRARNAVASR